MSLNPNQCCLVSSLTPHVFVTFLLKQTTNRHVWSTFMSQCKRYNNITFFFKKHIDYNTCTILSSNIIQDTAACWKVNTWSMYTFDWWHHICFITTSSKYNNCVVMITIWLDDHQTMRTWTTHTDKYEYEAM